MFSRGLRGCHHVFGALVPSRRSCSLVEGLPSSKSSPAPRQTSRTAAYCRENTASVREAFSAIDRSSAFVRSIEFVHSFNFVRYGRQSATAAFFAPERVEYSSDA